MPKFRKKPVVIEAIRWTGENFEELFEWGSPDGSYSKAGILRSGAGDNLSKLAVYTLEGVLTASMGDWIIKGVKNEFYPCKPDIFEATYEAVKEGP